MSVKITAFGNCQHFFLFVPLRILVRVPRPWKSCYLSVNQSGSLRTKSLRWGKVSLCAQRHGSASHPIAQCAWDREMASQRLQTQVRVGALVTLPKEIVGAARVTNHCGVDTQAGKIHWWCTVGLDAGFVEGVRLSACRDCDGTGLWGQGKVWASGENFRVVLRAEVVSQAVRLNRQRRERVES